MRVAAQNRVRALGAGSLLAAVLVWMAAVPLLASQEIVILTPDPRIRLTAEAESGLLSGEIEAGVRISSAILRIARLAGVEVQLRADLGEIPRAIALDGVTVETALERVSRGHSLALFYGASGDTPRSLRTVWVVAEGDPSSSPVRLSAAWSQPTETEEAPQDPVLTRAIGQRDIARLSYSADPTAIEKLREIASHSPDPVLRRSALSALAGVDPRGSFALFESIGLRDTSADVRIEAARSVMRTSNHRGGAVVRAAGQREKDPVVRDILLRLAAGESVARHASGLSRDRALR